VSIIKRLEDKEDAIDTLLKETRMDTIHNTDTTTTTDSERQRKGVRELLEKLCRNCEYSVVEKVLSLCTKKQPSNEDLQSLFLFSCKLNDPTTARRFTAELQNRGHNTPTEDYHTLLKACEKNGNVYEALLAVKAMAASKTLKDSATTTFHAFTQVCKRAQSFNQAMEGMMILTLAQETEEEGGVAEITGPLLDYLGEIATKRRPNKNQKEDRKGIRV